MKKTLCLLAKSPVLPCHRCGGTGCPLSLSLAWPDIVVLVPAPLWRGAGEGLLLAMPFLHAPEKSTPLLLKGKLLCSVPHFSGCLQCLFDIILL